MKPKKIPFRFPAALLMLSLVVLPAIGQDRALPDAPTPQHASNTSQIAPTKWYGVVDPGQPALPLSRKDKLVFWLHEEVEPTSLLPAFISAGYGQLTGGDPKFGTDSGAFGERLGAAALREASMRFFSDSLLPALTHEDPRYFRMAYGGVKKRGTYALERVVIDRKNSGLRGINFSDTMGRLVASSLTTTYYPAASVNAGVVFKTWGTAMGGEAANNLFLEFWPDIRDAVFHRHKEH
jgi:hypothetical protein